MSEGNSGLEPIYVAHLPGRAFFSMTISFDSLRLPALIALMAHSVPVTPLVLSWCHASTYAYLYFAPTLFVQPGRS